VQIDRRELHGKFRYSTTCPADSQEIENLPEQTEIQIQGIEGLKQALNILLISLG
jgi:hypothetical protein